MIDNLRSRCLRLCENLWVGPCFPFAGEAKSARFPIRFSANPCGSFTKIAGPNVGFVKQ